jgi:hypothetical protein
LNIGQLFVRLTADPAGVKRGAKQASDSLLTLEGAAKRVGSALAAAFAARAIISFGQDSLRTFAEAEAIWNRLAGTVNATGASFEAAQPQIRAAAAEMQKLTTIGDEDFARGLQRLVTQTQDVSAALGLMPLAADLAAAGQMDVAQASELLGRALAGNTMQLTRMFPALKESTDLFGDLQEIVAGMAQQEAQTLQGQLKQMGNAWGDFKEALGEALSAMSGGTPIFQQIIAGVQDMTAWVERNKDQVQKLGAAMVAFGGFAMRQLDRVIRGFGIFHDAVLRVWRLLRRGGDGPDLSFLDHITDGAPAAGAALERALVLPVVKARNETQRMGREVEKVVNLWERMAKLGQIGMVAPMATTPRVGSVDIDAGALAAFNENLRRMKEAGEGMILTFKETPAAVRIAVDAQVSAARELADSLKRFGGDSLDALGREIAWTASMFTPAGLAAVGLGAMLDRLSPAIDALLMPVVALGEAAAEGLLPIFHALTKVIALVIEGWGKFLRGIGALLNKLPGSLGKGLVESGQGMIDLAERMRATTRAQEEATESLHKLSSAASNVPPLFDLALRRRQAALGGALPTGGAAGGGTTIVINNPPAGMDTDRVARDVERAILERQRRGGVTEWDVNFSPVAL